MHDCLFTVPKWIPSLPMAPKLWLLLLIQPSDILKSADRFPMMSTPRAQVLHDLHTLLRDWIHTYTILVSYPHPPVSVETSFQMPHLVQTSSTWNQRL